MASQRGTVTSIPARKGPTWPEIRDMVVGRLKEGMIVMDSSPVRKVDVASDLEGERGVCPKKEMEGEADELLEGAEVVAMLMIECV